MFSLVFGDVVEYLKARNRPNSIPPNISNYKFGGRGFCSQLKPNICALSQRQMRLSFFFQLKPNWLKLRKHRCRCLALVALVALLSMDLACSSLLRILVALLANANIANAGTEHCRCLWTAILTHVCRTILYMARLRALLLQGLSSSG